MEGLTRRIRAGSNSKIEEWRLFCIKEKSIYSVLNLCSGDMVLRVNVWFPAAEEQAIQQVLVDCGKGNPERAMLMKSKSVAGVPPTYTKTNEFTEGWQDVINT